MNITKQIEAKIKGFPLGTTFGYNELNIPNEKFTTAAKAIERLLKKGVIKKLAKGTFYKPEQTVFGELKPDEKEMIKPYLFKNGKRIAYVTGTLLYNQLGLTTQVPSTIKIASLTKRIYVNKGTIKAKPVKSYVEVTESNYYLLGLLDAIKDLNKIPNLNYSNAIKRLIELLAELKKPEVKNLVNFALKYPPRVRALLGALLEETSNQNLEVLKQSLNPITVYKLGISDATLSTLKNWNIK
jgi:Family of unknown function (DUF6088)